MAMQQQQAPAAASAASAASEVDEELAAIQRLVKIEEAKKAKRELQQRLESMMDERLSAAVAPSPKAKRGIGQAVEEEALEKEAAPLKKAKPMSVIERMEAMQRGGSSSSNTASMMDVKQVEKMFAVRVIESNIGAIAAGKSAEVRRLLAIMLAGAMVHESEMQDTENKGGQQNLSGALMMNLLRQSVISLCEFTTGPKEVGALPGKIAKVERELVETANEVSKVIGDRIRGWLPVPEAARGAYGSYTQIILGHHMIEMGVQEKDQTDQRQDQQQQHHQDYQQRKKRH